MSEYIISELFVYPIKSLGGISVSQAFVEARGLQHDRRFMLIDQDKMFITQRENAQMALLGVRLLENGLEIFHKIKNLEPLHIPFDFVSQKNVQVSIWDDICEAQTTAQEFSEWFSEALAIKCDLVCMPETSKRLVDTRYAHQNETTRFTDGYPFLIIGQSSLDDLNERLSTPVEMLRFRPNIVFVNGAAFEEDTWERFELAGIDFKVAKPCSRCVLTTIDPNTAQKGKEPLKTLATYRNFNGKILFGQNLLHNQKEGIIKVGDRISPSLKN